MATRQRVRGEDATALSIMAGAGHDLRQPIQSLLLMAHLMALTDDSDKRKQTARSMENALQMLQAMIGDMVRVARLETGIVSSTITEVDLGALAKDAAARQGRVSASHGIELIVEPASVIAKADASLAAEIIGGLIRNAVALAKGGTVSIMTRQSPQPGVDVAFDCPSPLGKHLDTTFIEISEGDAGVTPTPGIKLLKVLARQTGARVRISSASETRHVLSLTFGN